MDGATFLRSLREAIGEPPGSQYVDARSAYQYGWEAAIELARRTRSLRTTQSITTVAETTSYTLNADFLELDLRDGRGDLIIKYSDGTSTYWLPMKSYDEIVRAENTTSQTVPNCFAIIDKPTLYSQITGAATSDGATSGGLATLTDTAGLFTTTDYVSVGDIVHNVTDASSGIVISITSATALQTAMYSDSDGSAASWATDDAYVIQPQGRLQIVLDPPPSTAGHTITLYYIQRPAPVFHSYGVYRTPSHYHNALVDYAAASMKLRDREPGMWDVFRKEWSGRVGVVGEAANNSMNRKGFRMRLQGR